MKLIKGNRFEALKQATAEHEIMGSDIISMELADALEGKGISIVPDDILIPEQFRDAYHFYCLEVQTNDVAEFIKIVAHRRALSIADYKGGEGGVYKAMQKMYGRGKITMLHDPLKDENALKSSKTSELTAIKMEFEKVFGRKTKSKNVELLREQIEAEKAKTAPKSRARKTETND